MRPKKAVNSVHGCQIARMMGLCACARWGLLFTHSVDVLRTSLTVIFYFSLKVSTRLVTFIFALNARTSENNFSRLQNNMNLFDLWMTSSLLNPSPLRKLLIRTMMHQALVGRRIVSVNHLIDLEDFGLTNCNRGALTTPKIPGKV